jgi:sigma-B regulation protein RsbU (phosphoserine phosphatase)
MLSLLALAFVVSTYLSIQATQATLIETLQQELSAQAEAKADLIRARLVASRSVATDLAAAAEVTKYERNAMLNVIQSTVAHNEQVFGSAIAYEPYQFQPDILYWAPYYSRPDNSGNLQFTQLGNASYNYFQRDWYILPKETNKPVLLPPSLDVGGGKVWLVRWSVPFHDPKTGAFRGVATADIAFSQTQELVNQIIVGEKGYAFMLDSQGVILGVGSNGGSFQPMENSMLILAQTLKNKEWENLVVSMRTTDKTEFTRVVDMQGRPMLVAYTPIKMSTGWQNHRKLKTRLLFTQAWSR